MMEDYPGPKKDQGEIIICTGHLAVDEMVPSEFRSGLGHIPLVLDQFSRNVIVFCEQLPFEFV